MKCDSFMRNVSASEEDKVRERVELGRGWGGGRATKSLQERRGRRRVVHFLDYKKKGSQHGCGAGMAFAAAITWLF